PAHRGTPASPSTPHSTTRITPLNLCVPSYLTHRRGVGLPRNFLHAPTPEFAAASFRVPRSRSFLPMLPDNVAPVATLLPPPCPNPKTPALPKFAAFARSPGSPRSLSKTAHSLAPATKSPRRSASARKATARRFDAGGPPPWRVLPNSPARSRAEVFHSEELPTKDRAASAPPSRLPG